jgi:hypothetical protein
MMSRIRLFISLLALLLSLSATAQKLPDCLESAQKALRRMSAPGEPKSSGNGYMCRYRVKTVMKDTKLPESVSDITIKIGAGKVHYLSDEIRVFQDERMSITVLSSRRQVYVAPPQKNALKGQGVDVFSYVQDTLFTMGTLKECRRMEDGRRKAVLELSPKGRKLFRFDEVEFHQEKDNSLAGVVIRYSSESPVSRLEYAYSTIDRKYSGRELSTPVEKLFFDASGKPLPEYRGYQFTDTRKEKK